MKLDKLKEVLKNEPKYRLKQARDAVFKSLIDDWSSATYLPPKLREVLNKECPLEVRGEVVESDDDVLKAIITLDDGLKIESVLMRHMGGRSTVCVSSQVGCPMKCGFCATGAMGLIRNLTEDEIVGQVLFFARYLKSHGEDKVTNVVFMGMGEPFLNYDNVLSAVRTLNEKDGLNIGARKISISTSGVIEGINKLAEENLQVNLAISLHAPYDELRLKLMPVNIKYPLKEVLSAVDSYINKTSRQVMFEYIMLKGINDSKEDAERLARLMKKPLHFVNLIVYNPTGKEGMEPSSHNSVRKFKEILEKAGIPVSERYRFGGEIKAACGQLATESR
ncbi:MAG: 23S rRNA (adenine(2503)-C(2))-methyltransferase RlmN [Parcubacteria group bacterium]|nr:23S rRNA (adenine(2503)-C(2))-methyltransferase RlmN [Parcubacteria group bacterium]MCR4342909.1 23S rRNA (adenine(2503)-C(2))-methyltransferase RlmN [Patescibacteria group bacterium]